MTPELIGFYAVAALMVGSALAMVAARNVVHAVLFMVANFVGTTLLYLWLQAPFIAAVQLIVYAGAIMVLFLFVVMLLGTRDLTLSEPLAGQRFWGLALTGVLGLLLVFVVAEGAPAAPPDGPPAVEALPRAKGAEPAGGRSGGAATDAAGASGADAGGGSAAAAANDAVAGAGAFGSPQMIGDVLYTDHVLAFEVVSVLLLAAMLGAIVIARFRGGMVEVEPEGTSTPTSSPTAAGSK